MKFVNVVGNQFINCELITRVVLERYMSHGRSRAIVYMADGHSVIIGPFNSWQAVVDDLEELGVDVRSLR